MTKKRFVKLLMSLGYSRDKAQREAARVKGYRGSVSYSQRYKTLYACAVCAKAASNLTKVWITLGTMFTGIKSELIDFFERAYEAGGNAGDETEHTV